MPLDRPEGLRVGIVRQDFAGRPGPEAEEAADRAAALLSGAGAAVSEAIPPASFAEAWAVQPTLQNFAARAALAWEYDHGRDLLAPNVRAALDAASSIGAAEYDEARRVANRARREAKDLFASFDAVLAYPASGAAPGGLASTGDPRFTRLWSLLGTPCVNVPSVTEAGGLPVGVQVAAPFGQDALALAAGHLLERALGR